jgi:perosamine synthetase
MSITQSVLKGFHAAYWLNSIYFKDLSAKEVQKVALHLIKKGIEVRSGFWPLAKMNFFNSVYISGNDKVSDSIFEKSLTLPSNINLKYKDIIFIKNTIEKKLKQIF